MILQLSFTVLTLLPVVRSFSTFTPNCTVAVETVNVVNGPNSRSTWDILFSSLFTIVACSWSIQHLNIPEQRHGRDPGFWGDQKWMFKRLLRSINWMLISILAPEWILGIAVGNFSDALAYRKRFKEWATLDGIEWTLKHGFYTNIGGFAIRVKSSREKGPNVDRNQCLEVGGHNDTAPNHGKQRIDFSNTTYNADAVDILQTVENSIPSSGQSSVPNKEPQTKGDMVSEVIFHLTSSSLLQLREEGFIKKLPQMTSDEIDDRSKSDVFTKIITIVQVLSVILQVIVRRATNLTISQLELAATAFSVCAMITYSLTLYQPKDIQTIHILQNDADCLTFENAYRICVAGRSEKTAKSHFQHGGLDKGISWGEGGQGLSVMLGALFGAIIFGALHCCGWFFFFPTYQELLLWRIACVATTFVPILMAAVAYFTDEDPDQRSNFVYLALIVTIILYIIARLYIMVEVFRTLFYLPPDAFIATWPNSIPQFS